MENGHTSVTAVAEHEAHGAGGAHGHDHAHGGHGHDGHGHDSMDTHGGHASDGERNFTLLQKLYIPELLKGMLHAIGKVFTRPFTVQYVGPESPWDAEHRHIPQNGYRGEHYLKRHESGMEKCVACYMCSTACPAQCIEIDAEEAPASEFGEERFKRPAVFNIDMLKCIYCGYCVEACPKDAIGMTTTFNQVGTRRADFIYDKSRLLHNNDKYMAEHALTPWGRAKDGSYPFSPDGCGPEITHGMDAWRVAKRLQEMSEERVQRRAKAA